MTLKQTTNFSSLVVDPSEWTVTVILSQRQQSSVKGKSLQTWHGRDNNSLKRSQEKHSSPGLGHKYLHFLEI